jgi:hypothetical protein
MQIPHLKTFPNQNTLLPGLGTADEREELNRIMENIPESTPPVEIEDISEREIKTLSAFVL